MPKFRDEVFTAHVTQTTRPTSESPDKSLPRQTYRESAAATQLLAKIRLYGTRLYRYKYDFHKRFVKNEQILNLNFRRSKFFPSIRSREKHFVFVTTSLGLFWKYFFKPKCFKKSKTMYLVTAAFLRKVLLFSSLAHVCLIVNRTPRYFNEILNKIIEPSISTYTHPFAETKHEVIESETPVNFKFSSLMFLNSKNYGLTKTRKRGRLKRRIYRRLVAINRVLD